MELHVVTEIDMNYFYLKQDISHNQFDKANM